MKESLSYKNINKIGKKDIVIGIPNKNCVSTISYVIETVDMGLSKYLKDKKNIITIVDSSDDNSKEIIKKTYDALKNRSILINQEPRGKGVAIHSIFRIAKKVGAKAVILFDADLRSIEPDWVYKLLNPIIDKGYDFVAPYYFRHKYDATITNSIVYPLTAALYGQRVRQPIGGEFAFSERLINYYLNCKWESSIFCFGIDTWLTQKAIIYDNAKVCQVFLGNKIHDPSVKNLEDPKESIGIMFRQVVDTNFKIMLEEEDFWKRTRSSASVRFFGEVEFEKPQQVELNIKIMHDIFLAQNRYYKNFWKTFLIKENYSQIEKLAKARLNNFKIDGNLWARLVYNFAAVYHKAKIKEKQRIVRSLMPLYFAWVVSFVNKTKNLSSQDVEKDIEKQREAFEEEKWFLIENWSK